MKFFHYYGEINHQITSICLMNKGNLIIKSKLETLPWLDKDLSRFENKSRMKQLGGSMYIYSINSRKMIIHSLMNLQESLFHNLKRENLNLNFWNLHSDIQFYTEIKCLRQLNNCLKHANGEINIDDVKNNELVSFYDLQRNTSFEYLEIDIDNLIYSMYCFLKILILKYLDCDYDKINRLPSKEDFISSIHEKFYFSELSK